MQCIPEHPVGLYCPSRDSSSCMKQLRGHCIASAAPPKLTPKSTKSSSSHLLFLFLKPNPFFSLQVFRYTTTMSGFLQSKTKYSRANTEQESSENLLSDEELHVRQPEKSGEKLRRTLMISFYAIGTLLACFVTGMVGYNWQRDLDGICTDHISEFCKFCYVSPRSQWPNHSQLLW